MRVQLRCYRRRQAVMIPLRGTEALRGWVRCSKPTCRCGNVDMEPHGPCWYLAGRRTGRSSKHMVRTGRLWV
ncbi:DUF6788 family protein [Methanothrix sp.]|uniref:DUF6788 family protein n=1 Tax=Methanothrix sp. TaxID=90426 RepID=UPI00257C2C5C|nr:DUF6788 family protein [Methanothrix sp.]